MKLSRYHRLIPGLICFAFSAVACHEDVPAAEVTPPPPPAAAVAAPAPPPTDLFVDATAETGLDFVHDNGMTGAFYMPENMGAGAALADLDGDGDLDLYLVQGGEIGPNAKPTASDRLYRNDLAETGRLRFTDVTAEARLAPASGYGMGVAAGDYDNDGHVDLYVTAFGSNRLLHNRGDATFEDVTVEAGVDDPRWSVPAVFFDYDADGWLDLYVGNYLDFTYARHRPCQTKAGSADYCGPEVYTSVPDRLFHNRGAGADGRVTFEDVTAAAGLDAAFGKALGAVSADFNGDGRVDLYVANDGTLNQLWLNQGDGAFVDEALFAGCAVNGEGLSEASMGVDAADYDADGDLDLFMTHFANETHTLMRNDGKGQFEDVTVAAGLGAVSLETTGFGTGFVDADGDGVLDLLAVNGAVRAIEALVAAGDPYPYHQTNQLFLGRRDGRFEQVGEGGVFAVSEVSRGAAFGDLDNDGDVDVVVTNNNGPARVWLDVSRLDVKQPDRGWAGLRVTTGRRDALGAKVELLRPGQAPIVRRVGTDGSYASASDPRVVFALDSHEAVRVHVVWPDGRSEVRDDVPSGRYVTLEEAGQ